MRIRSCILSLIIALGVVSFVFAAREHPFEGSFDVNQHELTLNFPFDDNQYAKVHLTRVALGEYKFTFLTEGLKTPLFDISTQLSGHVVIDKNSTDTMPIIRGTVKSENTLFNYQPIRELACNFQIEGRSLAFNECSYGAFASQGLIHLSTKPKLDMKLELSKVPLDDFVRMGVDKVKDTFYIEGFVDGFANITANLGGVSLSGDLSSLNARLGKYEADSIFLNYQGKWPQIDVSDAIVTTKEGSTFVADGPIDFSQKGTIVDQILAFNRSLIVQKDEQQTEWVLKRIKTSETSSEAKTKYFIREVEDIDATSGGVDMFGIEHSVNF